MKSILIIIFFTFNIFAYSGFSAEEQAWLEIHKGKTFSLAANPNWMPYEAFNKELQYVGMVSKYLQIIEKSTDVKFLPIFVSQWSEILELSKNQQVAVISADIRDDVLNDNYIPINPYIIDPIIIMMKQYQSNLRSLEYIKDKKIVIIDGYGYTSKLVNQYKEIDFIKVENIQEGLQKLQNDEVDAMLAPKMLATYQLEKMDLADIQIVGVTNITMELTLFVDKRLETLYSILDKIVQDISINQKHKVQRVNTLTKQEILDLSIYLILAGLFVIIFFLLFRVYKANLRSRRTLTLLKDVEKFAYIGSWEYDIRTGNINWSDEVFTIFGEKPQSFQPTYEKLLSYIPQYYHDGFKKAVDRSIKKGTSYEYDHEIRRTDGKTRFIKEAGYARLDKNNKTYMVVGTTLDITSIIDARNETIENAKITDLLRRFDENVIASNTDLKGIIVYASAALCQISGFTKEELIGVPHNILRHQDMKKKTFFHMWRTLKLGRTWYGEMKNKTKDGSFYWIEGSIEPIIGYDEKIIGYSSIMHEITKDKEVHELNEELQNLNMSLEKKIEDAVYDSKIKSQALAQQNKLASMGEMICNIAHQWRQPLNTLALVIQKISFSHQKEKLTDDMLIASIDKAMNLIQQMSGTIDDFKNFFEVDKNWSNVKLIDVINHTLGIIGTTLENNNISIIVECEKDIELICLKNELAQVILNLLSNANDAISINNIQSPKITIYGTLVDDVITISVSDNAGGIATDIIDKIFEPYFTTKEENKGTGIGLYMSKSIIETNMNGTLSVENTPFGVRFTISLPKIKACPLYIQSV